MNIVGGTMSSSYGTMNIIGGTMSSIYGTMRIMGGTMSNGKHVCVLSWEVSSGNDEIYLWNHEHHWWKQMK